MLDRHHPDIAEFLRMLEAEVEQKRDGLERPDKDLTATTYLRGQVKSLRWVIGKINGDGDEDK